MYVEKGWYGLPVVLLLLFLLAGCVHQMATKDNTPKEETTAQNPLNEQSNKKSTKDWEITQNPHPKVLEMHKGYGNYNDQFIFYFDTLSGAMDKNEVVEIAKKLLNCSPEDDFIYFPEDNFFNKKSIKNGKNSKFGKWAHKGMEVNDYRFNFRPIDKGKLKNKLYLKYNKEFDADLSDMMSVDSAMQIVKSKANAQFLSDRFCWDAPYDMQCSPKISLRIFPTVRNYVIIDHLFFYNICLDKKIVLLPYCKFGIYVNAKTGETMPTANVSGYSIYKK